LFPRGFRAPRAQTGKRIKSGRRGGLVMPCSGDFKTRHGVMSADEMANDEEKTDSLECRWHWTISNFLRY